MECISSADYIGDGALHKEKEMQQLRMMLEDTQYKYVIADSKLSDVE